MRKNNLSKIIKTSVALSLAAVVLLGCSDKTKETAVIEAMETEEASSLSFNFIGGSDVMPIAGYYGPYVASYSEDAQSPPNYITEEYWEMIADSGINLMSYSTADYASVPEEVIKNLEYGEKYGIAVTVTDSKVISMGAEDEVSMDELTTRLSEYMNYPAFAGLYMIDEPCTSYFLPAEESLQYRYLDYYKTLAPILNQEIDIYTYTNAYPSGLGDNEFERYETYIREFYDTLQPNYLLFDRYPFDEAQEGYINRYFYDLAIVRMVAEEKEIPFWTFIQAGSQWNDSQGRFDSVTPYYPNEGQFDWNVNTCLAFGAKGINYFPMIQPYHFAYAESEAFDFERNGLIGAWGNKTQWYYYAQDINKHIGAIDEVLMNSVNKGVLACGKQATNDMGLAKDYNVLLEGTSWRELKSVDGDALIGCFNYQGKTALYVVNYSTENAQKVNLTFQDTYNVTVIQNAETSDLQGSGMTLDMLPGEGVLLVFE